MTNRKAFATERRYHGYAGVTDVSPFSYGVWRSYFELGERASHSRFWSGPTSSIALETQYISSCITDALKFGHEAFIADLADDA